MNATPSTILPESFSFVKVWRCELRLALIIRLILSLFRSSNLVGFGSTSTKAYSHYVSCEHNSYNFTWTAHIIINCFPNDGCAIVYCISQISSLDMKSILLKSVWNGISNPCDIQITCTYSDVKQYWIKGEVGTVRLV